MAASKTPRSGAKVFLLALLGLGVLPLLPEVGLWLANPSDFRTIAPILYYQGIVSFLLLLPALLLPHRLRQIWVGLFAGAVGAVTLIIGFYSAINGTRWNMTAHNALTQSNSTEAGSYLSAFIHPGVMTWIVFLGAMFTTCAVLAVRAAAPRWRQRLRVAGAGILLAAPGLALAVRGGGPPEPRLPVHGASAPHVYPIGDHLLHPFTLFAATHYNFRTIHRFYLRQFHPDQAQLAQFAGATTIPGAVSPRVLVVVIGESATRRHWSLYGYPRATTPRLAALGDAIHLFTDVVSTSVGTLESIRGILTTAGDSRPVFRLFAGAGYATHWISAQYNQGFDSLELAALVSACDDRVYLNGAHDENLLPLLATAAARPGRQMIFLHLIGSHVRYRDRYPPGHGIFKGTTANERLRADYDNSIHYTDTVLAEVVEILRKLGDSASLVYFSDHGEDVFDSRPDKYLFRDDALATNPMYEVPFFVWLSPPYLRDNPDFAHQLTAATGRPFQNRVLYHSLLSLARLAHPLYDPAADLFSPAFVAHERQVGVPSHVYHRDP